jgi:serine/threonine protein kinase
MAYLHSRQPAPGILHGDLKTSNLLLEDDGQRVVIADFGLAGWLRRGGSGGTASGTAAGMSAAEQMGALTTTIAPPEVGGRELDN